MSVTMQNINPLTALRSLKGAPLSCLVALIFANQPVGKEWLARVTGYSDKPVSSAMDYLLEMGFVINGGRTEAWAIHHEFRQLSMGNPELFLNSSRNYSDSEATTTALIVDSINMHKIAVAEEVELEEEIVTNDFSESLEIIKSAGIGEPMASRLARMYHINPYYLTAHLLQAQKDEINIRLLIHRLRSRDPAPRLNHNYHLVGCKCSQCFHFVYSQDKGLLPSEEFDYKSYLQSVTIECI
jgi:hypothetical protein